MPLVGWIADILDATEFQFTPRQILESEDLFPGLWDDIAIEIWQRRLIDQQVSEERANGG